MQDFAQSIALFFKLLALICEMCFSLLLLLRFFWWNWESFKQKMLCTAIYRIHHTLLNIHTATRCEIQHWISIGNANVNGKGKGMVIHIQFLFKNYMYVSMGTLIIYIAILFLWFWLFQQCAHESQLLVKCCTRMLKVSIMVLRLKSSVWFYFRDC